MSPARTTTKTTATKTTPSTAASPVTALSDPAAEAAIHAACRILALPTVREQAAPLAQAAARERLSHKAYLAEVLPAECDDREAYRREIPAKAAWCTEWWKHPEAVCRLSGMWRSWEALRLEPGTGASVWWRDHADHHMAKLLDPQGPFKGCTKDAHGANKVLQPLPFGDPPPELYAPLTYAV